MVNFPVFCAVLFGTPVIVLGWYSLMTWTNHFALVWSSFVRACANVLATIAVILAPVARPVWRLWSAACDVADRRVFTPYGRYAPAACFVLLALVCAYELGNG